MIGNTGSADRIIRVILGIAIVSAGYYFQTWWGAIGAIPLVTGALNFCPVYYLLGISTRTTDSDVSEVV